MDEVVLNVIIDIHRLVESLNELEEHLLEDQENRELPAIPDPDKRMCEEVRALLINMEPDFDGDICEVKVGSIAQKYSEQVGRQVSDQRMGRVLRKLGLPARRTRIGFLMRWAKGSLNAE